MNRSPTKQSSASNSPNVMHNPTPSPRSSTCQAVTSNDLPLMLSASQIKIISIMTYILNKFYNVSDNSTIQSLKLIDLIVDQTYPESLTLRKLNDSLSNRQYQYFNTISRNKDITRCPIFCIGIYSIFKWGGNRGNAIRFDNFTEVPLVGDISRSGTPTNEYTPNVSEIPHYSTNSHGNKILRSSLEPPNEFIEVLFPWLNLLEEDFQNKDRTNYNLHSLFELFHFLGKVVVQDLAYLSCTGILPHLQSIIMEHIPKLYQCSFFKTFKKDLQKEIDGDSVQSDWCNILMDKIEESFIEVSKKFTVENTRLTQEVKDLKLELSDMKQLVSQILQSQRQILSGSSTSNNASNGILILDKNSISSNLLNNLVNGEEQPHSLAPINMFPSLSSSAVQDTQKRKLPLPNSQPFSPQLIDSPFKKFKFDESKSHTATTNGANATTLDSILSKSITSPRIPIPTLTTGATPTQLSSQSATPVASTGTAKRTSTSSSTGAPNEAIKYKLSRDNKTIWDLYTEWYLGLPGKPSIKSLIEKFGWRRWKVSDDSHFFPTRRIIIDYIERECKRGLRLGRFSLEQDREEIKKIVAQDLEKFRMSNGLTLNSLSLYFRNLTRENKEICMYDNFQDWSLLLINDDDKNKYCKRQQTNAV